MKQLFRITLVVLLAFGCCIQALYFAFAVSGASAMNESLPEERDSVFEDFVRESLENFRNEMMKGISVINVPVLEPLELRNLEIRIRQDVGGIDLYIPEVTIHGLSKFKVHGIAANFEQLSLKIHVFLPSVSASGQYKASGKFAKLFPVYGDGNFSLNVSEAMLSAGGNMDFLNGTLQVTALEIGLDYEDMVMDLENFLGGGGFSTVVQRLLPAIGKVMLRKFQGEVMNEVGKSLMAELNKHLKHPEVKELVEKLLAPTVSLMTVNI